MMNEFLSRNDRPVERASGVGAARAVTPGTERGAGRVVMPSLPPPADTPDAALSPASEEHLSSAAEYARAQLRIADLLADLRSGGGGAAGLDATEAEIAGLLPHARIVLPLPPVDPMVLDHAVALARAMHDAAEMTRTAQANVAPATVQQILGRQASQ